MGKKILEDSTEYKNNFTRKPKTGYGESLTNACPAFFYTPNGTFHKDIATFPFPIFSSLQQEI
jgi:hypothetical protein